MNKRDVIPYLENKYDQEFELVSSRLVIGTGNYDLRVSPKNNSELIFLTEYFPKTKKFNDYYPNALWQFEGDKEVRSFLDDFSIPYVLRTGLSIYIEPDPKNISKYADLVKTDPDKISLNISLHLFGGNDPETLSLLQKLDAHLREMNLKKTGFTTSIYNKASLGGKETKDLNFDFGLHSEGTFESENKKHFIGLIKYRINPEIKTSPSAEELSEILKPTTHMIFSTL